MINEFVNYLNTLKFWSFQIALTHRNWFNVGKEKVLSSDRPRRLPLLMLSGISRVNKSAPRQELPLPAHSWSGAWLCCSEKEAAIFPEWQNISVRPNLENFYNKSPNQSVHRQCTGNGRVTAVQFTCFPAAHQAGS